MRYLDQIKYYKKVRKCRSCGREGLVLDKDGLCHQCWQDAKDAERERVEEGKRKEK